MEQFDELLRSMAKKEEIIVPNGFEERTQDVLDSLPARAKKVGLGAVKTALLAAAACAVLLGTAFAASPTLRELMGSFAPYAQEQEDKTYTMDGFEVKVLSALSDGSTIRAWVQVKDLEGHRLSADMVPWGEVNVMTDEELDGLAADGVYWSFSFDSGYAVYNEEDETALLVFTGWGQNFGDLSNATLRIRHIYDYLDPSQREYVPDESHPGHPGQGSGDIEIVTVKDISGFTLNDVQLTIPLTVESTDKLTMEKDSALAKALNAEWVELSPLGLTAAFEHGVPDALTFNPIRVRMKDGAELDWEKQGEWNPSGGATYYDREQQIYGQIEIWNFADAIDLEQVESVYVCGKYFPIR